MSRLAAPGAAAVVLLWCLLLAWFPLRDLDWGWHLATFARWMAEGRLPWDDRFSYASEGAYEPVHTVFQLAIGGLHALFGPGGLVLYRMAMHAAIGLALCVAFRRSGAGPWTAAALALLVLSGSTFRLLERPHLFTTLGLVLLLERLVAIRARGAHPWPLVPLLAVWSCAHPGVVFGAMALLGFVAAEALLGFVRGGPRPEWLVRLAVWSVPALLATGLNPLSYDLYPYLVVGHRELQGAVDIAELRGLFRHPERGIDDHARMAGLWSLGALLLLRRPRRIDPTLGLMGLAFAVLAVVLAREGPLALIVLAFALAPALAPSLGRLTPRTRAWLLALALLPSGLDAALHLGARLERGVRAPAVDPGWYPVQPADWLVGHRPLGRLCNSNWTGGYLVYRLAPLGMQVHTDGRMPLYGRALKESRAPAPGQPWGVEARWHPQVLLLDWGPRPGLAYYPEVGDPEFHARWALVHVSSGGKVYLRRDGPNGDLVARFGYREMRWRGRELLPSSDPETLAKELARARVVDPANPHLKGP